MSRAALVRLVPVMLAALTLGGCSTFFSQMTGRRSRGASNACTVKAKQIDARIRAARTQRPDAAGHFAGSWKCVADGFGAEYWRISQNEGRLTGVVSDPGGGTSWILEGGIEGHTAVLKSNGGSYYALEIDGSAASGEVTVQVQDTESCVVAHSVCTRI